MAPFNLANYLLKRRNVFVSNLSRILFVTPSVTRIGIGRNRIRVVRSWAHDDLDHEPRLLLFRNKNYYVQDEDTKSLGEDKIHKFLSVFLHANVSLNILFHSGVITSHSYSTLYCFNLIYISSFIIKYNYIITVLYNILASDDWARPLTAQPRLQIGVEASAGPFKMASAYYGSGYALPMTRYPVMIMMIILSAIVCVLLVHVTFGWNLCVIPSDFNCVLSCCWSIITAHRVLLSSITPWLVLSVITHLIRFCCSNVNTRVRHSRFSLYDCEF